MARPAHPGRFIKTEVLEPLGLSVTRAAEVLKVTRPALSALLNGRAALSPDMALRIEKAFGLKMDTLLRMQTAYDIAEARARESKIKVKRYRPAMKDTERSALARFQERLARREPVNLTVSPVDIIRERRGPL